MWCPDWTVNTPAVHNDKRISQVLTFQEWYRHGPFAAQPQLHRTVVPEAYRTIEAGPIYMINMSPPAGGRHKIRSPGTD
jgi:hypothetical protein